MPNDFPIPSLAPLAPELFLLAAACALLLADLWVPKDRKGITGYMALGAVVVTAALTLLQFGDPAVTTFAAHEGAQGMVVVDTFSNVFKLVLYGATILTILIGMDFLEAEKQHQGEYYVLLLFALLGLMFMTSANDLLVVYLGLELSALSIYVLVGFFREEKRSTEAALKYFVLGSLASGFVLYGMSLIYGATGATLLPSIALALGGVEGQHLILSFGLVFFLAGFLFKISAAPFHMWTPDAFEGAPTPVTAFMAVAPKAAALAVMMRVLVDALPSLTEQWSSIIMVAAVLTMFVGNIAAIAQTSVKRMLAYSSIAHIGFALLGLVAANQLGYMSVVLYMVVYLLMNFGAFGGLIMLRRRGISGENLSDFSGLATDRPGVGLMMLILFFSLAGVPPTVGFIGKLYPILAVVEAGHMTVAVLAVLASVIGAFFYLRVVWYIYFNKPDEKFSDVNLSPAMAGVIGLSAVTVLWFGIAPSTLVTLSNAAVHGGLILP